MSSDNSSTADELALLMDLKLMPVCWPVALMTAERRGRIMFQNYKVILDHYGSSQGHRISDKRCIFILGEVLVWQLQPRELSGTLSLSPPPPTLYLLFLSVWLLEASGIQATQYSPLSGLRVIGIHIQRWVIHTWTTKSHNRVGENLYSINSQICFVKRRSGCIDF